MNEELSLRLQAYADGELLEGDAREMADFLAEDADARALLAELKNTRSALANYEAEIKLPESREFYWSKIEREIRRQEGVAPRQPEPSSSLFVAWRRLLVPAGALAVLILLVFVLFPQTQAPPTLASVEAEFTLADSDAFTYQDYANGTTLVWLSYPAEKEFADTDSEETLD